MVLVLFNESFPDIFDLVKLFDTLGMLALMSIAIWWFHKQYSEKNAEIQSLQKRVFEIELANITTMQELTTTIKKHNELIEKIIQKIN